MERVNVLRENPTIWRDHAYGGALINAILELEAKAHSYIHITSSPIPLRIYSDEIRRQLLKLAKEKSFDELVNMWFSGVYARYTGLQYYEQFRVGDKPVIPGSSVKGAVRSRLELLSKAYRGVNISCFIRASPLRGKPPRGTNGWRHVEIWKQTVFEDRGEPCNATSWNYYEDIYVCKICDLFGTSGLASRLDFTTYYTREEDSLEELKVFIACNKEKNTYVKAIVEAFKPNTVFNGAVHLKGLTLDELGLLAIGMNLHITDKPILLGRFKYRRLAICSENRAKPIVFGRISFKPVKLKLSILQENGLRKIISNRDMGYRYEGSSIVIEGSDLKDLIDLAVEEAYQKYGNYIIRDFDEISALENIWKDGREWWIDCRCEER